MAGDTVEWKNRTQMVHTVTDIPGIANIPGDAVLPPGAGPFSSGGIMAGGTYRHTFTVIGRYKYFCRLHELFHMTGEVVVTGGKK
jgi:plastocyanin